MPNIVFDKLFDLMLPLGLEHDFFNGLDCDHKSVHILDQHVITSDQKLFSVGPRSYHSLKVCRRL